MSPLPNKNEGSLESPQTLPPDWEHQPPNTLDLHALFRLSPADHAAAKGRQHLLVKKLSEPQPYYQTVGELSDFLDDRAYEHSSEVINQLSQHTDLALQTLLLSNGSLRIETGISLEPKSSKQDKKHVQHVIMYDEPKIKDVLSGENRSNLLLFVFKLLHIQHQHPPFTTQFKIVSDNLKPKFRTIDYGLMLNHLHQPCSELSDTQERFNYYTNSLKSAALFLHYVMTHQATQSVRHLHDAYYRYFIEHVKSDVLIDIQDKIQLLKMAELCYGYTRLADKNIKASDITLFTHTPKQTINLLNALKKPLEEKLIFAEPDTLNPKDANKQILTVLNQCYQPYADSLTHLPITSPEGTHDKHDFVTAAYRKLHEFHGEITTAIHALNYPKQPS